MGPTSKWLFSPRTPEWESRNRASRDSRDFGAPITLWADLGSRCGLKQSCSSCRKLSNGMLHIVCSQVNRVDSRLFLVGSQIGSLTPDPSFGHNLCFKCPNVQCEPILDIYIPWDFQRYKKTPQAIEFWPLKLLSEVSRVHRNSISQSGSCLRSVRVHSLTLSHTPGSMWCDSWAFSWPALLQPLCLGREPKARVATINLCLMAFTSGHTFCFYSSLFSSCINNFSFNTWKVKCTTKLVNNFKVYKSKYGLCKIP
jgi:hypothetical protein